MNASLSFLLLLLLTLVSCGDKHSKSPAIARKIVKLTQAQIEYVMENQKFSCASLAGATCPEGMARLIYFNKDDAELSTVCSGFMVNQNTLVTNQHCISSQDICDNTYIAIYNGHSYQRTKCQSIKKIISDNLEAEDPNKKIDVAVIELEDEYFGNTLKVAHSSTRPVASEVLSAWVVDHTGLDNSPKSPLESRITQFHCVVSSQTEMKSLVLENCPVVEGNSGSPVMNEYDEVVGIIWGGNARKNTSWNLDERRASEFVAASTAAYYFSSALLN